MVVLFLSVKNLKITKKKSLKSLLCPRNDTKLHLVVRLEFWSHPFIAITPRSTDPMW